MAFGSAGAGHVVTETTENGLPIQFRGVVPRAAPSWIHIVGEGVGARRSSARLPAVLRLVSRARHISGGGFGPICISALGRRALDERDLMIQRIGRLARSRT